MAIGDRIVLDDISGEVVAADDKTYTVRWETGKEGGCEMTYTHDVNWGSDNA